MQMMARLFSLLCPIVLRRYNFSLRSPLKERSAEHDVAGITARIDATFENSGIISNRWFAINRSAAEQFKCLRSTARTYFKTRTLISFRLPK